MLCGFAPSLQAAEISGAWQIGTRGGPVPLCKLTQVGNNLSGSCVGPQAAGTATGTIVGPLVRFHWQWTTYVGNAAGAFDFAGTLQSDNSITGTVERPGIGLSLNFTATRQSTTVAANLRAPGGVPSGPASSYPLSAQPGAVATAPSDAHRPNLNNTLQEAEAYYAKGPSPAVVASARQTYLGYADLSDAQIRQRLVPSHTRQGMLSGEWLDRVLMIAFQGDARPISLREGWNTSETAFNIRDAGIDPQIEARALKLFPAVSQMKQRTQYIIDQMNAAADRQQGNSYSVRIAK
jgi:hypothetical protein